MDSIVKVLSAFLSIIQILSSGMLYPDEMKTVNAPYGVFIGSDTEKLLGLRNYDVLVVDASYLTADEISTIRRNGNKEIYSYLNIGSVEGFRDYYDNFLPYTLGIYENWEDERWVDVSSRQWQEHISETASELMSKGIDGLFADNADVYYVYPENEIFSGLVDIFQDFSKQSIKVIVNGGDNFITKCIAEQKLPGCIAGINQETVFTSIDFENKTFGESGIEAREYFLKYAELCSQNGIEVYLIEYGAGEELINSIRAFCRIKGYKCYFAETIELD